MKCPFCGNADTQVVETRVSEDGDFIRRRRRMTSPSSDSRVSATWVSGWLQNGQRMR